MGRCQFRTAVDQLVRISGCESILELDGHQIELRVGFMGM